MSDKKKKMGKWGEEKAAGWLLKKGFEIIEKNHFQKWGEIDIVARRKNRYHFVEVKTLKLNPNFRNAGLCPEDQITKDKLSKIKISALAYANRRQIEDWQIDLVAIEIDKERRIFNLRFWENI